MTTKGAFLDWVSCHGAQRHRKYMHGEEDAKSLGKKKLTREYKL